MGFDRTFFVTTVTWQRTPLFRDQQRAELMMDVLTHYREQKKYVLHEFVITPDHLHLLLTPASGISLERALQLIKGGFSYRLGKPKLGLVWQESFTNHRIRNEQDYHAEYIHMNPVRARLAEKRVVPVFIRQLWKSGYWPSCSRGGLFLAPCVDLEDRPDAHTSLESPWRGHLWPR